MLSIELLLWVFAALSTGFWLINWQKLRKPSGMMFISKNEDGQTSLFLELDCEPEVFENDKYVIFEIVQGDWNIAE